MRRGGGIDCERMTDFVNEAILQELHAQYRSIYIRVNSGDNVSIYISLCACIYRAIYCSQRACRRSLIFPPSSSLGAFWTETNLETKIYVCLSTSFYLSVSLSLSLPFLFSVSSRWKSTGSKYKTKEEVSSPGCCCSSRVISLSVLCLVFFLLCRD